MVEPVWKISWMKSMVRFTPAGAAFDHHGTLVFITTVINTTHLTLHEILTSMMVLIENAMKLFRIKLRLGVWYNLQAAYLEICEGHMTWIYYLRNGTFQLIMRRM